MPAAIPDAELCNISKLNGYLLACYGASSAPLSSDTIINDLQDLSPSDFAVDTVIDEIRYVKGLTASGFELLNSAFTLLEETTISRQNSEQFAEVLSNAPEVSVALISAASFARRVATVATNLSQLCMNTAERLNADPTQLVKELEARTKCGERAKGTDLEKKLASYLDFTPNTRWAQLELPLKNRVGFKKTTAIISEGKVEEEELKVTEVRRKHQRNPTGFHKFNFKDLGVEDSDVESECRRSRAGSARGGSTDGGSTRGSVSCSGGPAGALTSRSASSGGEDNDLEDLAEKDGAVFQLEHRLNSSVVFSFDKERQVIQDEVADPKWEEQQRHQKRFSRIRNRVPTGHPSLMRGPSDELAGIVNDYEKQLTSMQLDTTTAENTELNKRVTPAPVDEAAQRAAAAALLAAQGGQKRNVTMADDV